MAEPNLRESMERAGGNLVAMLDPTRNYLPRWSVEMQRDGGARCGNAWPSHNVGRWWDALLRLEAATGYAIPAALEAPMMENLAACLENPLGICGHLSTRGAAVVPDPAGWFDIHSQRECLLALTALVRYRRSARGLARGRGMVAALERWILADGTWDIPGMVHACRAGGGTPPEDAVETYGAMGPVRTVESHGRLLEALLEFHLATGDERARALAERLARFHVEVTTPPDGTAPDGEHTHTHSHLNTLRGLLLYGQVSGERAYVDRVAVTYAVTVRRYVRRSGFVSHDLRTERDGETGSLGDAIQLALRLGLDGHPALLDDAERLVRCRMLPSQVTTPPRLHPAGEGDGDEYARLDERTFGALGGLLTHAHGEARPTTDVSAAALHALCDVYTHSVSATAAGVRVHFLLDHEERGVTVHCERGAAALIHVDLAEALPLAVRVPRWAAEGSVSLTVDGRAVRPDLRGCYLHAPAGRRFRIQHDLPEETVTERLDGVDYRIHWRGDEILGITPNTDWMPFYPTL